MVDSCEILIDAFGRIPPLVHRITDGLDRADLTHRLDADANPIGWLIWHLTRVEDHHVSEIADLPQAWVTEGWAERFGMEADPQDIGYGHRSGEVAAFDPGSTQLLVDYHDAVAARTMQLLDTITETDLDRIIDYRWDPPVTVGVRLVSVTGDCLQHLGQAAFARGIIERQR